MIEITNGDIGWKPRECRTCALLKCSVPVAEKNRDIRAGQCDIKFSIMVEITDCQEAAIRVPRGNRLCKPDFRLRFQSIETNCLDCPR